MTQKRFSLFLLLTCLLLSAKLSFAQRVITNTEEKRAEKAPQSLKSKLWYGGGLQLGFSSYSGSNVFSFGLSPMVGYKIIEQISVGPRVEVTYTSYKQQGYKALALFDIDAGAFIRFRVFRGLFLQGELTNAWLQQGIIINGSGALEKTKTQRFNQRLGAGWNFGSGAQASSEIGVFYNFAIANDINAYENPLGYRFGFTWNF